MTDDFRRFSSSGIGWKVTAQGVFVENSGFERTLGPPITVTKNLENIRYRADTRRN